jgi:hypothetical protein
VHRGTAALYGQRVKGDLDILRKKLKFGPGWHRAVLKTRLVYPSNVFATIHVPTVHTANGLKNKARKI